ncbi:MAG: UvrB/UvrC motif-containing protein, partial [Alistipes sp.]
DMNVYRTEIDHDCRPMAADVEKSYSASENVDALITKAKEDMERAAKSLDFLAAARFRDRMYELQKLKEKR